MSLICIYIYIYIGTLSHFVSPFLPHAYMVTESHPLSHYKQKLLTSAYVASAQASQGTVDGILLMAALCRSSTASKDSVALSADVKVRVEYLGVVGLIAPRKQFLSPSPPPTHPSSLSSTILPQALLKFSLLSISSIYSIIGAHTNQNEQLSFVDSFAKFVFASKLPVDRGFLVNALKIRNTVFYIYISIHNIVFLYLYFNL